MGLCPPYKQQNLAKAVAFARFLFLSLDYCLGKLQIERLARRALLSTLFGLVNNSLESLGVVNSEVGENLTVDLDALLVDETDELAVGETLETGSRIDTLNPEGAESALLVLAIPVGVGLTLLPGVLGYSPDVLTTAEVALSEFEDSFAPCA